jgi:hypothetical protein
MYRLAFYTNRIFLSKNIEKVLSFGVEPMTYRFVLMRVLPPVKSAVIKDVGGKGLLKKVFWSEQDLRDSDDIQTV